jgi:predicted nucleic acid-binding protein
MTGLDSNILIQLAAADHPRNSATVSLFEAENRRGETFALPSVAVTEFLHIITDARRFDPPMTQIVAINWIEGFLTLSSVKIIEPDTASLRLMLGWMRQYRLGRKRIIDTHLATMLYRGGVRRFMTSNPKDFEIFGVFEFVVP